MIKILKRFTNNMLGEFRDIIHGNKNLGDMIENRYSQSSVEGDVSVEEAMEIPAVQASVELITSSVASLPIKLQRVDKANEVTEIKDDRRLFLLNREPNNIMNAHNFKKQIVKDYLFYGAAYIKVDKLPVGNKYQALHILDPRYITPIKRDGNGYVADVKYKYESPDTKEVIMINSRQMIVVLRDSRDGITGTGILDQNSEVLRLALNEIRYSSSILENGVLPLGVLKTDQIISDKAMLRLRESFDSAYQGAKNTGKTIILENGLEYKPVSLKPNDLDLSNSKKSTLSNIARIFGVPESMINSEANKYSSNEQNNIHFLQYCITPILDSIISSLDRTLLLELEKIRNYEFKFDTSKILQTTEKEKIEAVGEGYERGLYTANEARRKLGLPDIAANDYYLSSLGSIFVNAKSGIMAIPNLGKVIDPSEMDKTQMTKNDMHKLEKLIEEAKNPEIDIEEILKD